MSAVIALKRHFHTNSVKAGKASAQKIDRYGEVCAALESVKPLQAEADALKKELIAEFTAKGDGRTELTVRGLKYILVLGPRSMERSIRDIKALLSKVGLDRFLGLVRPMLTEVDKALSAGDKIELIASEPGYRRIKAVVAGR